MARWTQIAILLAMTVLLLDILRRVILLLTGSERFSWLAVLIVFCVAAGNFVWGYSRKNKTFQE